MSKVLTALTAGALALGLNSAAFSADPQQGQSQEQEKEYIAALKKCGIRTKQKIAAWDH